MASSSSQKGKLLVIGSVPSVSCDIMAHEDETVESITQQIQSKLKLQVKEPLRTSITVKMMDNNATLCSLVAQAHQCSTVVFEFPSATVEGQGEGRKGKLGGQDDAIATLQAEMRDLIRETRDLRFRDKEKSKAIAQQNKTIAQQNETIAQLDREKSKAIAQQNETIAQQNETIVQLRLSHDNLAHKFQQQQASFFPVRRRIVLDRARLEIAKKYKIPINDLRIRSTGHTSKQRSITAAHVQALVCRVHAVLNTTDKQLLNMSILEIIFDPANNSLRGDGNDAAHQAAQQDLADAVLTADLTVTERAKLAAIYKFAYSYF